MGGPLFELTMIQAKAGELPKALACNVVASMQRIAGKHKADNPDQKPPEPGALMSNTCTSSTTYLKHVWTYCTQVATNWKFAVCR